MSRLHKQPPRLPALLVTGTCVRTPIQLRVNTHTHTHTHTHCPVMLSLHTHAHMGGSRFRSVVQHAPTRTHTHPHPHPTPTPPPPPPGGLAATCCLNLVFTALLLAATGQRLLARSVDPRNETLG